MTNAEVVTDIKLQEALDAIVAEINRHGRSSCDGLKYVQLHCDDELRQRYGEKRLLHMAYERFESASPELSKKATQWFHEFNKQYFSGQLEPCEVKVRYGADDDTPLSDREWFTINIYGIWEDDDIRGILLDEMLLMATAVESCTIRKREWSRLKQAGAPVHPFGAVALRHRSSPISSETGPALPLSKDGNDNAGT